jgi:thiaminase
MKIDFELHGMAENAAEPDTHQLDLAGPSLSEQMCVRLSSIFGHAMQLEIDFHDAPYL